MPKLPKTAPSTNLRTTAEMKPWRAPRFFRPTPRTMLRTPAVIREEWRSKTLWPQRPRWHDTKILVRETAQSRLKEHYHKTLADDLMHMHYVHEPNSRADPRVIRGIFNADDPYSKNKFNPIAGGDRFVRKRLPESTGDNIVKLDKIVLHTFQKDAIGNKSFLLGCIAAFRAMSGATREGGGRHTSEGIRIVSTPCSIGIYSGLEFCLF